jgi:hypothetical protein
MERIGGHGFALPLPGILDVGDSVSETPELDADWAGPDEHADRGGPAGLTARAARGIRLRLDVTDLEVLAELRRHPEGAARNRFAQGALRVGVLSLRMASGQLDAGTVREEGQKLLAEVRELMVGRTTELGERVAAALTQYLDPKAGALPQRLEALVARDGQLERLLQAHVGPEQSTLERTLVTHLGSQSPLGRLLSPTEAGGIRAQITDTVRGALEEQRKAIVRELSPDNKDSALGRLFGELKERQGELRRDLSLDEEGSALSRFMRRIDTGLKNLTLDDEQSALSRLRRELGTALEQMVRRDQELHGELKAALAALAARRDEAARSTRHGGAFEAELGRLLATEAQRAGDVLEAVGAQTGDIKNCKVGDFVIELGADSAAPGARIVFEAKDDKSYDLKQALLEMDRARKNRRAGVGVFVLARGAAPEGMPAFARHGDDFVVVWDPEDPASDFQVRGAYSLARALSTRARARASNGERHEALRAMERSLRAIEKQLQYLADIRSWAETVKGHGEKIADRARRMEADLQKEIAAVDAGIAELGADEEAEAGPSPET